MNLFGQTEYACLMADPPWKERGGGVIKRGADRHYSLLDRQQIIDVLRPEWTMAENAHGWIWTTDNFLIDALAVGAALGMRYVRTFVWVKILVDDDDHAIMVEREIRGRILRRPEVRFGIGQYGRGAHELLLFFVRGSGQDESVWTGARNVPSVFFAPVPRGADGKRIHSRKPRESYDLIERVSKGPRLECFARVAQPGWKLFGNQAPETESETMT
jgi:N6-adenosine-specific RNA methylase IME4